MDLETRLLEQLQHIVASHPPVAMASSFGAEDMVLMDLIGRHRLAIGIFTLDTGRLPAQTYDLIAQASVHYRLRVQVFCPDAAQVEDYVRINGINAFYDSVAQRRACCAVRKVAPLARALQGKGAWITGLRRDQAPSRAAAALQEVDAVHGIPKFNPLVDWTQDDVWAYLRSHAVPYNALHDQGYPSIGCAPCTRAVAAGEDARAGRWWWEAAAGKECGLHPAGLGRATQEAI
jgi:phosphoadenosine phosphosulfate reductase